MMVCLKILGIPVGQHEYVRQFLEEGRRAPHIFPTHPHGEKTHRRLGCFCSCAHQPEPIFGWERSNPTFAETHDAHVWECLRWILNTEGDQQKSLLRRRQDQRGNPLGQLSRLPENGAPETPSSG